MAQYLTQRTRAHGVTVRVGVAVLPEYGTKMKSLLKIIDQLMDKAKGQEKH